MRIFRWILTYPLAIIGGSMFMMFLHSVSGWVFPEADMALIPQNDPEALERFMDEISLRAKWAVMVSHWLGAAMGALLAMLVAPLREAWVARQPDWKSTLPGWVMGVWFSIGGAMNAAMIPMPSWMVVVDLLGYVPVAYAVSIWWVRRRYA